MRKGVGIVFSLILILSLAFVSASVLSDFWDRITGNTVIVPDDDGNKNLCGNGIKDSGELCDYAATDTKNNPYGVQCTKGCWIDGADPRWKGCRGSGAHVCVDNPKVTDQYFVDNPNCIKNPTCGGLFFDCNGVVCPEPKQISKNETEDDDPVERCFGTSCEVSIFSSKTTLVDGKNAVVVDAHQTWTANIVGAKWIWSEEEVGNPQEDKTVTFTKKFRLDTENKIYNVGPGLLMVAADNSYECYINGKLVGKDDSKNNFASGQEDFHSFVSLDKEINTVTLICNVKNWGEPGATSESNPAGLLYRLLIPYREKSDFCIDTDGGYNIYDKGSVSLGNDIFTDFCSIGSSSWQENLSSEHDLIESYCTNTDETGVHIRALAYCENGCYDGACVSNESGFYPYPFLTTATASEDVRIVYGTVRGISAVEAIQAGNIEVDLQSRTSVDIGDVLISDVAANLHNKNLIVVGTLTGANEACSNGAMLDVVGVSSCEALKEAVGIGQGQWLIQTYENPWQQGKIATLLVGYDLEELVASTRYLITQPRIGTSVGTGYIGNIGTIGDGESFCDENFLCILYTGDTITYVDSSGEEHTFSISFISTSEVRLEIDGNQKVFTDDTPMTIGNLIISLKSLGYEEGNTGFAQFTIEETEDVNCQGCFEDGTCYPLGYRKGGEYCSISLEFVAQMEEGAQCENSFECDSNVCASGECIGRTFIQRILGFFRRLFGG